MRFFEKREEAIEFLKTIAPAERSISDITIITRESSNPRKNLNGGDYDRWLHCVLIVPGLYRAIEDWSAEWPIDDYDHMDGYVVVSQEDLR